MGNYQLPSRIRFYTSKLLYAYTTGQLNADVLGMEDTQLGIEEEAFRILTLDPSKITSGFVGGYQAQGDKNRIKYTFPDKPDNNYIKYLFDYNYIMCLGHNFFEADMGLETSALYDDGSTQKMNITDIVNGLSNINGPTYNGFSISKITNNHMGNNQSGVHLEFNQPADADSPASLGSLLMGKYWDSPQNCDINTSIEYKYGAKQKKTSGGKTISKLNYYKPDKWLMDAWHLDRYISDTRGDNVPSRTGIRVWNISFSLLHQKYAMNQWNHIEKSVGYSQSGDYAGGANVSSYSILDSIDFYTNVVNMTLGSHLPFVIQLDATDAEGNTSNNNADTFAIVRMKNYKITQTNPKFCKISMTLEEQV